MAAVRRANGLAGGLRAGANTLVDRRDDAFASFALLARTVADLDLARLRGEQRTAMQHTMPLWIQREAESA
jgi:hypothetical protein